MTKHHNGEVVGFTFQEIPLEEARTVVLAGDGHYSDVKQALLGRLPNLPPDKAFAFGLPNGREVPEDQRRGICMAINATLKRAKLEWRVTYSGVKKLFICVPKTIREKTGKHSATNHTAFSAEDQRVFALREQGLSANKISQQVSLPVERVRYLVYQVAAQRKKAEKTAPEKVRVMNVRDSRTGELSYSASKLVQTARRVFNYSGDFKNGDAKVIRKAISVVGVKDLGIPPRDISPLVGISTDGVYFNANSARSDFGSEEIKALLKAVKQEG